jgi:hypothetical protein
VPLVNHEQLFILNRQFSWGRKREGQTPQWSKEKEKDRQHNGQKKKRRTDNTMAKRKREGQTTQWSKEKEKDRQHNGQKTIVLSVLLFFF